MIGSGRIIGLILIGVGALVAILGIMYFLTNTETDPSAKTLGIGFCLVPAAVIAGFGVWFMMQGKTETAQFAEVEKQKKILNMVATQGTVQLGNIALETGMTLDQVKNALYDLVGKGLFTGYVDWKGGKLVSADAAAINQAVISGKCPNCGAPQVVGGKGVIRCEFCGTEFFIPKSAQSATPAAPPVQPGPPPPA
jgi:ribosomal protein S27E